MSHLGIAITGLLLLVSLAPGCDRVEVAATSVQEQARSNPPLEPEPSVDSPAGTDKSRTQLIELFSGYEFVPDASDLNRVGTPDEVVPVLIALFHSENISPQQRHHALRALRHYPDHPDAMATLETVIVDDEGNALARQVAVRAYGRALNDEAIDLLALMLEHKDDLIRITARAALEHIDSEESRRVLAEDSSLDSNVSATSNSSFAEDPLP
ncbi:HEAT repeat domain-containing protein [Lujinxingia vulgaris]|uniref:HEAT repeat domain-containing protein n=1 Tax=Lujinxingia vulgaris TaxID=2600176 RepID=A0A5C6X8T2_9DELT|nr:HEAT repeat domain-containing protein [Lujinxingia vulgaris]TXD37768.1 HEAT repeat domain-containing protein [Lujinxingia vulgaris]